MQRWIKRLKRQSCRTHRRAKKKNTPAEIKCTKPEENSQLFCLIAWCLMVNLQAVLAGVSDAVCVYMLCVWVCMLETLRTMGCYWSMQSYDATTTPEAPITPATQTHIYKCTATHKHTHFFFFFKHRFWPLKCLVVGSKHSFGSDEELRCVLHNGDIFICARHPVDVFHDSI